MTVWADRPHVLYILQHSVSIKKWLDIIELEFVWRDVVRCGRVENMIQVVRKEISGQRFACNFRSRSNALIHPNKRRSVDIPLRVTDSS